jgi:hypothetical protein
MAEVRTAPDAAAARAADGGTTVALKEWGAAVHALLDGRQTILLRKGGIHEKAFVPPAAGGGFVLFPTTAHSHAERTRPEHHDLLGPGAADVAADHVVVRAGVEVVGVVAVARPDRLPEIGDLHIWTDASIDEDRVRFRPAKPLQVLVVRAVALPDPVHLPRRDAYGGCTSWVDVHLAWDGRGRAVHGRDRLDADLARVRAAVS